MKIQYEKVDKSLAKPLFELFKNKCAYCEQLLSLNVQKKGTHWVVDRFRPISSYPWLAYNWSNLYLSCTECSSSKGQEFPLLNPEDQAQGLSELSSESPLLLDPCADHPEHLLRYHLETQSHKIILTASENGNPARASATIKILDLNRPSLTSSRLSQWQVLEKAFPLVLQKTSLTPKALDSLLVTKSEKLLGASSTFAGMKRQMISANILSKVGDETGEFITPELGKLLEPELGIEHALGESRAASTSKSHEPTSAEKFEASDMPDSLPIKHAAIKSVSITNFKAISSITFRPMEAPEEDVLEKEEQDTIERLMGWTTLIGENGSGKSSILQAITLALAGNEIQKNQQLKPSRFLTRGKRSGRIVLGLSNGEKISLKITKTKFTFEEGGDPSGIFVRAYGSTRLLPNEPDDVETESPSRSEYKNMFNPFIPLIDAGAWLNSLNNNDFTPARLAIKDLLGLRDEQDVENRSGKIEVDEQPLENLSSGYQTLVALACDIMAGVPEGVSDMRYAQGIILLDEIGAHLHPAWKMRIVARLRKTFPLMQFFISTHEPLCLRGHSKGEVLVIKRDFDGDREVRIEDDLPSPKGLRVDQLLTSEHFGMDSTIDPAIDESFNEYYQLLADKGIKEGSQHAARRDTLGHDLQGYGILGYTRRDQLVYKLIDEYLADEKAGKVSKAGNPERWQEVKKRVADLWQFAEAFERKRDQ